MELKITNISPIIPTAVLYWDYIDVVNGQEVDVQNFILEIFENGNIKHTATIGLNPDGTPITLYTIPESAELKWNASYDIRISELYKPSNLLWGTQKLEGPMQHFDTPTDEYYDNIIFYTDYESITTYKMQEFVKIYWKFIDINPLNIVSAYINPSKVFGKNENTIDFILEQTGFKTAIIDETTKFTLYVQLIDDVLITREFTITLIKKELIIPEGTFNIDTIDRGENVVYMGKSYLTYFVPQKIRSITVYFVFKNAGVESSVKVGEKTVIDDSLFGTNVPITVIANYVDGYAPLEPNTGVYAKCRYEAIDIDGNKIINDVEQFKFINVV